MSRMDAHGNDEVANTIEAILMLWQIFKPAEDIAKRMHLPTSDVEYVIANGCFPDRQLKLNWADDTEATSTDSQPYNYEREGQR